MLHLPRRDRRTYASLDSRSRHRRRSRCRLARCLPGRPQSLRIRGAPVHIQVPAVRSGRERVEHRCLRWRAVPRRHGAGWLVAVPRGREDAACSRALRPGEPGSMLPRYDGHLEESKHGQCGTRRPHQTVQVSGVNPQRSRFHAIEQQLWIRRSWCYQVWLNIVSFIWYLLFIDNLLFIEYLFIIIEYLFIIIEYLFIIIEYLFIIIEYLFIIIEYQFIIIEYLFKMYWLFWILIKY